MLYFLLLLNFYFVRLPYPLRFELYFLFDTVLSRRRTRIAAHVRAARFTTVYAGDKRSFPHKIVCGATAAITPPRSSIRYLLASLSHISYYAILHPTFSRFLLLSPDFRCLIYTLATPHKTQLHLPERRKSTDISMSGCLFASHSIPTSVA